MTRRAVALRLRAGLHVLRGCVAGGAFRVVKGRLPDGILMGVVTCRATNADVGGIVALAVGEPVRLKADIVDAARTVDRDLRPGAMTTAAAVRHFFGGEAGEFGHLTFSGIAGTHRP